ncbi:hypothetical protein B1R94_15180 [Mycolicibacterium litorale]|nr:hypothetical protein B1R94_15180 [Mycolicibacterium litorale]
MQTSWRWPSDLDEAVALVASGGTAVGGGAALLSVALAPKLGQLAVDLAAVLPAGVDRGVIGAGTTVEQLATDPTVLRDWPAIAAAAAATATPQVRRVATLGGTLGARLPTSDMFAAMAAHGCLVRMRGAAATTTEVPVVDYLRAPPGPHVVLGVRPTLPGPGTHRRFALRVGPSPAIAVVAGVRAGDVVRLFAGAVGHTAAPLPFAGRSAPSVDLMRSDGRGSADYRHRLVGVLCAEVLAAVGADT